MSNVVQGSGQWVELPEGRVLPWVLGGEDAHRSWHWQYPSGSRVLVRAEHRAGPTCRRQPSPIAPQRPDLLAPRHNTSDPLPNSAATPPQTPHCGAKGKAAPMRRGYELLMEYGGEEYIVLLYTWTLGLCGWLWRLVTCRRAEEGDEDDGEDDEEGGGGKGAGQQPHPHHHARGQPPQFHGASLQRRQFLRTMSRGLSSRLPPLFAVHDDRPRDCGEPFEKNYDGHMDRHRQARLLTALSFFLLYVIWAVMVWVRLPCRRIRPLPGGPSSPVPGKGRAHRRRGGRLALQQGERALHSPPAPAPAVHPSVRPRDLQSPRSVRGGARRLFSPSRREGRHPPPAPSALSKIPPRHARLPQHRRLTSLNPSFPRHAAAPRRRPQTSFASQWGVGCLMDNVQQWKDVVQDVLTALVVLYVLDKIRFTDDRVWFERLLDNMSGAQAACENWVCAQRQGTATASGSAGCS